MVGQFAYFASRLRAIVALAFRNRSVVAGVAGFIAMIILLTLRISLPVAFRLLIALAFKAAFDLIAFAFIGATIFSMVVT
jgi:hypothetical protein